MHDAEFVQRPGDISPNPLNYDYSATISSIKPKEANNYGQTHFNPGIKIKPISVFAGRKMKHGVTFYSLDFLCSAEQKFLSSDRMCLSIFTVNAAAMQQ